MARLYNREALVVILGGLAGVSVLGWAAGLGVYVGLAIVGWLVASIPIAMLIQQALVPLYLQLGFSDRALNLAIEIRESAPNRRLRDLGSVDVALVQAMLGRLDDALRNLDRVNAKGLQERSQALVLGNRAWCRAHLGRDLDDALEQARQARALDPDEGILEYFEGLVLFRLGRTAEARERIESSLKREKSPQLPVPGERAWILAQVLAAEGEADGARELIAEAQRRAGRRNPFREQIEQTHRELVSAAA